MLILEARAQAFSIFQKSETKQIKTESLSWNSAYIAIIPEEYFDEMLWNSGKQFRQTIPQMSANKSATRRQYVYVL